MAIFASPPEITRPSAYELSVSLGESFAPKVTKKAMPSPFYL